MRRVIIEYIEAENNQQDIPKLYDLPNRINYGEIDLVLKTIKLSNSEGSFDNLESNNEN